jgi:hypothetical protein
MAEPVPTPWVKTSDVEDQIRQYLECWEVNGKRFFNFPEEIRFRNYFQESLTPCEQKFLIITKFPMDGLVYEAFRKMPILLLDTQRYQVNHDHFFYWAFTSDVYDFFKNDMLAVYDDEISGRYHLLMDTIMFYSHNPNRTQERERINGAVRELAPRLLNLQSGSFLVAAHLAYPLLEGIGRRVASALLDKDGSPKENVPNFDSVDGETVQVGRARVNRLSTLLRIVETKVAGENLRNDLSQYRNHFENVYSQYFGNKKTYDIIDEHRNSLLHGEAHWQIFYAAMINLICTLLTSCIPSITYDSKYPDLIKRLTLNQGMPRFHSGYYPPI